MQSPRRALVLASLLACACVTARTAAPRPDGPVREVLQEARPSLSAAPASFAQDVAADRAASPDELVRSFTAALSPQAREGLRHDPALDRVAQVVAQSYAATEQLPATTFLQWLQWKFGVTGEGRATLVQGADGWGARELLVQHLPQMAAQLPASDEAPRAFGLALVEAEAGRWALGIVAVAEQVRIKPIAKQQQAGGSFVLRGRIQVPAAEPKLWIDTGQGVKTIPVAATTDGSFEVTVQAPTQPGRHFVELAAVDPRAAASHGRRWQQSLLLVPFYVGVEEPADPEPIIRNPPKNPADRAQWPERILAVYNEARQERGLAPVHLDPVLGELATASVQAHLAHPELPPDTQLADTLARRGMPVRRVDQFRGELAFVDEAARSALWSPLFRDALLDPHLSSAGIALADGARGASYAQLFASPAPALDPVAESDRLLRAVNEVRARAGKPAFQADPELIAGAREVSRKVCAGELAAEGLDLSKQIKLTHPVKGANARWVVTPFVDPDDLDDELAAGDFTHAAVGVCRGKVGGYPDAEYALFLFVR